MHSRPVHSMDSMWDRVKMEGICIRLCEYFCLFMLRCLSFNNWFLFILLAQELRLSLCFLLLSIRFPFVSLLCGDLYRGENFSTTGIGVPSSPSLTPLTICFPCSVYSHIFSPICIFTSSTNTAPSCLHIAWSSITKGAVGLQLTGLVFSVHLSFHFPSSVSFPSLLSRHICNWLKKNAGHKGKWNDSLKIILLQGNDIVTVGHNYDSNFQVFWGLN